MEDVTQGNYEIRVNFRSQTDAADSITDVSGQFLGDSAIRSGW